MSSSFGVSNGDPGFTSAYETAERNIYWGTRPIEKIELESITIASTATDATNSPTTLLRAGLILGQVTATGFYVAYSPTATDGSQVAKLVLREEVNMLDPWTGAANTRVVSAVCLGPVKASALVNLDNVARRQLRAGGFVFDDDRVIGYGFPYLKPVEKAASYTVLASDVGTFFYASTGAVTFTLPTLAVGLYFWFYNTVDATMTVSSAAGDDIITDGDAAADSIAFQTANHKIGGGLLVFANEAATKWITIFQGAAPANAATVST